TKIAIIYNGITEYFTTADVDAYIAAHPGATELSTTIDNHVFTVSYTDIDPTANIVNAFTVGGLIGGTVNNNGVPSSPTTQVAVYTADGYASLEVQYESGDSFKVGQFSTSVTKLGSLVDLSVPLT